MVDIRSARRGESDRERSRGGARDYSHYYADQGFTSGEATNKAYKADDAAFQTSLAASQAEIATRQGEVATAKSQVDEQQAALSGIKTQLNTTVPVYLYDREGRKTQYNVPRSVANDLYSNKEVMGVWGTNDSSDYDPRGTGFTRTQVALPGVTGRTMDTMIQNSSGLAYDKVGVDDVALQNALHMRSMKGAASHPLAQALDTAQSDVNYQLAQQNAEIAKSQSTLDDYYTQLANAQGTVTTAQSENAAVIASRDKIKADLATDYTNRIKQLGEMYGGLNVTTG